MVKSQNLNSLKNMVCSLDKLHTELVTFLGLCKEQNKIIEAEINLRKSKECRAIL